MLLKGLETLTLRVRAMSEAAARLARWLEAHAAVERVLYPGLESFPQADLARRQMRAAARWWPFASAATGPRRSPCSTGCA